MVDTQLLEDTIKDSGKTKTHLAKKCNCSLQAFRLKMNNVYDFTTTQVDILCTELSITSLTRKEKIFFKK